LVTSAVPRLTWLFLPLLALSFAVAALRGGGDWRRLIKPNAALIAMLLVTGCTLLSAVWAANPAAAIGKGALLFFATLITFAAIGALAEVDAERLRRPALAFAAGAFLGGLFILFELLTDATLARAFGNLIAWFKPADAQQVLDGARAAKLNQNVAIVMFNLWSGLLALQMFEGRKRRAIASPLVSSILAARFAVVGLCVPFGAALAKGCGSHARRRLVPRFRARAAPEFRRLQCGSAPGVLDAELVQSEDHHLGVHSRARA
jgi:hypothetical protein